MTDMQLLILALPLIVIMALALGVIILMEDILNELKKIKKKSK